MKRKQNKRFKVGNIQAAFKATMDGSNKQRIEK